MNNKVKYINMPRVVECLSELSDKEVQLTLWNSSTGKISSFAEAICGLFNDSGIDAKYIATHYSNDLAKVFDDLEMAIDSVVVDGRNANELIRSNEMEIVRGISRRILNAIRNESG